MKKQGLIAGFALAAAMALSPYGISAAPETGPAIGDKVADGTVYAGTSPDTNKPLYTTPADAPSVYTWNAGEKYCSALQTSDHKDWRVPAKNELKVLFQNRAAIGNFDETGSNPVGWYWSSSPYYGLDAWAQCFSDGSQDYYSRESDSSLRCVR
jgi:hypothetical protein